MFKQLILGFSFLLLFSTIGMAQDQYQDLPCSEKEAVPENFTPAKSDMIYLKKTFWNVKYVKGDQSYPLGFRAKNLLKEFENSPEAKAELLKYRKTLTAALLTAVGGTALMFTGIALYSNRAGLNDIPPNVAESSLYLGGAGIAIVGSTIGATRSYNGLNKAIYLYNQSVIK